MQPASGLTAALFQNAQTVVEKVFQPGSSKSIFQNDFHMRFNVTVSGFCYDSNDRLCRHC
jgi:hypothetical protein